MFDLIIRDGQKESYINIKDNKLFGVNISNGIITNLTEEEVNIIKSLKLSNDKVYLGIEDGYEVYIDNNTLLKHYFKNGKEDIRKFIEINATVATLFDDNQNQLPEEEIEYQIEVKGKKKIFAKLKDLFVVFATTYIIIGGVVLGSEIYKLYQNKTPITYEEICTIINSCSNLTEDEKTWFTNEKLLNDIIPYYNGTNMGNIIRLRNTNLTIRNMMIEKY